MNGHNDETITPADVELVKTRAGARLARFGPLYARAGLDRDDVEAAGFEGLCKAIQTHDPDHPRAYDLTAWKSLHVSWSMQHQLRDVLRQVGPEFAAPDDPDDLEDDAVTLDHLTAEEHDQLRALLFERIETNDDLGVVFLRFYSGPVGAEPLTFTELGTILGRSRADLCRASQRGLAHLATLLRADDEE